MTPGENWKVSALTTVPSLLPSMLLKEEDQFSQDILTGQRLNIEQIS